MIESSQASQVKFLGYGICAVLILPRSTKISGVTGRVLNA